ncbi:MAG: adenosylcobalamin-dependent ribonucleoside-diphosphate reductase [Candidatus Binataceae bacterium]
MRNFSETAGVVLQERYLRRGPAGVIETPSEMLRRVAAAVAQPARQFGEDSASWQERFLARMENLEFLPNSPTLMNAGIPGGQLAACFVLPLRDDLDSIFETLGLAARIQQSGGGTGFSFSHLRPHGDLVRSTGGVSSGPLSFMDLFDHATSVIRSGGRRRGANMAVLRVDHPDIEEFINAKRAPERLHNFNLSVGITDAFLDALDSARPFALRNPRTASVARHVDPAQILDEMTAAAWACGEPGWLFLDQINRGHITPTLGTIEATNPCGEQPLLPYESCILGSLNVAAFSRGGGLHWERFGEAIHDAVVFLDNVIEANCYSSREIEQATRLTRKIGLGVMGWADFLAGAGLAYDSDAAIELGGRVAGFLTSKARQASAELGERRGSFPAFNASIWPGRGFAALRNATVTCVAPTGTISLLAGCSSGIEPLFALATSRRVLDDHTVVTVNPIARGALEQLGPAGASALTELTETGSLLNAAGIPDELKRRFRIALEIEPSIHLRMQAAFQSHIDAAVSKTVNLPPSAPPQAIKDLFALARSLRLKGLTVYRYGSREAQPLSLVHENARADCRECAL